jgi:hypothetical protein
MVAGICNCVPLFNTHLSSLHLYRSMLLLLLLELELLHLLLLLVNQRWVSTRT